jgi:hypothetical protein
VTFVSSKIFGDLACLERGVVNFEEEGSDSMEGGESHEEDEEEDWDGEGSDGDGKDPSSPPLPNTLPPGSPMPFPLQARI